MERSREFKLRFQFLIDPFSILSLIEVKLKSRSVGSSLGAIQILNTLSDAN
jgi:hypothetical protein